MNFLSDLNISANYQRMVNMKKEAKETIKKQMKNENSAFVPSKLESNKPIILSFVMPVWCYKHLMERINNMLLAQ